LVILTGKVIIGLGNMPDIFISEEEQKETPEVEPFVPEAIPEKPQYNETGNVANPLSAFIFHPKKIKFETKEGEEKVILVVRRHPITNLRWIVPAVLMVFAPLILSYVPFLSFLPKNFQIVTVLLWYLGTFAFTLLSFITWYFNVHIVTDERIIDIDYFNLVYKEVSDANLDKIQDVTYKMGGVARTMMNFGDVVIQTASEVPNFTFEAVPKPDKIAKILQELTVEEQKEAMEGRIR